MILVIIAGNAPLGILLPGDINGFPSGNILALSSGAGIYIQITVFIIRLIGRILQDNIVTGKLLGVCLIDPGFAVLESFIFFCFRIIFKPGMIYCKIIKPDNICSSSLCKNRLCPFRYS